MGVKPVLSSHPNPPGEMMVQRYPSPAPKRFAFLHRETCWAEGIIDPKFDG
jgi:hypothetical protein